MKRNVNPKFGGSTQQFDGVVSCSSSLTKILSQARLSGMLNLRGRQLTECPAALWNLHNEAFIDKENEQWWLMVELRQLDLSHNALLDIPADIGILGENLLDLDLSFNELSRLPLETCSFQVLKVLNLSHNKLRFVPKEIGNLSQSLVDLQLSHNAIEELPDSLCQLQELTTLNLDHNQLQHLPRDLGRIAGLQVFQANHNRLLALPASLAQCVRLSHLEVQYNQLTSPLLPPLTALSKLAVLDVRFNQLSSCPLLPMHGSLQQLHLGNNKLRDWTSLQNVTLPQLTTLTLNDNALSSVPAFLSQMPLKILDLSNNDLTAIPAEYGNIHTLNKLLLNGNPLRAIPASKLQLPIDALKKYLRSRIESTSDASTLPSSSSTTAAISNAASATMLEYVLRDAQCSKQLLLSKRGLSFLPVEEIANAVTCPLTHVDVSHNELTSAYEVGWDLLLLYRDSLIHLNLSHNRLRDLPSLAEGATSSSSYLPALQSLDLSHNLFTSAVFASSSSLVQPNLAWLSCCSARLLSLNLSHNNLTTIPACLLTPHLQTLDVSFNGLQHLPPVDALPLTLRELQVSNNQLAILPEDLYRLPSLHSLFLDNNSLISIPPQLALCPHLKALTLQGNPQKIIKPSIMVRGCEAALAFLRTKIPDDYVMNTQPLCSPYYKHPQSPALASSIASSPFSSSPSSSSSSRPSANCRWSASSSSGAAATCLRTSVNVRSENMSSGTVAGEKIGNTSIALQQLQTEIDKLVYELETNLSLSAAKRHATKKQLAMAKSKLLRATRSAGQ